MPSHLLILSHRDLAWLHQSYFLLNIATLWQEQGHKITLLHGPPRPFSPIRADLCLVHCDVTHVPKDHLDYARSFPRTLNAFGPGSADTSKRSISAGHLVSKTDHATGNWTGPVVVKTNNNSGGVIEARLAARGLRPLEPFWKPANYRVYPNPNEVPSEIWDNPGWVVERLLPETSLSPTGETQYHVRTYTFLGDRHTHNHWTSPVPVIKSDNMFNRAPIDPVPPELLARRKSLGLDFAKFDYCLHEGKPILFDVNRTPTFGHIPTHDLKPRLEHLSQGLQSLLDQPPHTRPL